MIAIPQADQDLECRLEVDRWYSAIRRWKSTPVYTYIPKMKAAMPLGGVVYTPPKHLKITYLPNREEIEEVLRAAIGEDFSYKAFAKELGVKEKDLLLYQQHLIDSGYTVRTMGQYATQERKLIGHWVRLPVGLVDALRVEGLFRLAPWEVEKMLRWMRYGHSSGPGSLESSLLKANGQFKDPIIRSKALFMACEWLRKELV